VRQVITMKIRTDGKGVAALCVFLRRISTFAVGATKRNINLSACSKKMRAVAVVPRQLRTFRVARVGFWGSLIPAREPGVGEIGFLRRTPSLYFL